MIKNAALQSSIFFLFFLYGIHNRDTGIFIGEKDNTRAQFVLYLLSQMLDIIQFDTICNKP